jgi:uncharacterized protein (TIGR02145 family)
MAENLDYNVEGSKCYGNSAESCAKYSRLYDWATAMGIDANYNSTSWSNINVNTQGVCPTGWHVPRDAEWDVLMTAVGGSSTAGTKLKTSTYWTTYSGVPAGTDEFGFSALPGGGGYSDGNFFNAGSSGYWWSSTEIDAYYAWSRSMDYGSEGVFRRDYGGKAALYSVRCVQD